MKCFNCNTDIPDDVKLCPNCGATTNKVEFAFQGLSKAFWAGVSFIVMAIFLFFFFKSCVFGIPSAKRSPPPTPVYQEQQNKVERTPKTTPEINKVCSLLGDLGLSTNGWKNIYDNEYGCSSRYKMIGENNIAYYVEGSANTVNSLKLVLNINTIVDEEKAREEYRQTVERLIIRAYNKPLPDEALWAIDNKRNYSEALDPFMINITTDMWATGKGYEIKVVIIPKNAQIK